MRLRETTAEDAVQLAEWWLGHGDRTMIDHALTAVEGLPVPSLPDSSYFQPLGDLAHCWLDERLAGTGLTCVEVVATRRSTDGRVTNFRVPIGGRFSRPLVGLVSLGRITYHIDTTEWPRATATLAGEYVVRTISPDGSRFRGALAAVAAHAISQKTERPE